MGGNSFPEASQALRRLARLAHVLLSVVVAHGLLPAPRRRRLAGKRGARTRAVLGGVGEFGHASAVIPSALRVSRRRQTSTASRLSRRELKAATFRQSAATASEIG